MQLCNERKEKLSKLIEILTQGNYSVNKKCDLFTLLFIKEINHKFINIKESDNEIESIALNLSEFLSDKCSEIIELNIDSIIEIIIEYIEKRDCELIQLSRDDIQKLNQVSIKRCWIKIINQIHHPMKNNWIILRILI